MIKKFEPVDFTAEEIELFEHPEKWDEWEHDNLDVPMYKAIGIVTAIYIVWEIIYALIG